MAINLRSTKGLHASGVKLLVYGNAGVGKTSLIPTLPTPIVFSAEGGLLSIADADVSYVEVSSYDTLMEAYRWVTESEEAKHFESIALDSISEIAEVVLNHEKKVAKDPRQAYGAMQEQMAASFVPFVTYLSTFTLQPSARRRLMRLGAFCMHLVCRATRLASSYLTSLMKYWHFVWRKMRRAWRNGL